MTTIAYKDGIVCADTQVTTSCRDSITTKIHYSKDLKAIAGSSGSCIDGDEFFNWFKTASFEDYATFEFKDKSDRNETTAVIFYKINNIEHVRFYNRDGTCLTRIMNSAYAIGSGHKFALGAMYAGLSAYEAVNIVSKLDPGTNDIITLLKLDLTY